MAGLIPRGTTYQLPVASALNLGGVKSGGDVTVNPDGTMDINHSSIIPSKRHGFHAFEYADQTAREAASGFVAEDVGKVAWQLDNNSFWVLGDISPVTWLNITNLAGAINSVVFNTSPTAVPYTAGQLIWDPFYKTLVLQTGSTNLQLGQEFYVYAQNDTGAIIPEGKAVYISGSTGTYPTISLAQANQEATSFAVIGVTTEEIAVGAMGFVTTQGMVHGLDTSAFTAGQALFLSETTAGAYIATEPLSPNYVVHIGHVVVADAVNGAIYVNVDTISQSADSVHVESGAGVQEINNVQDFFRHVWSTGITEGCDITDNGDGTVSITAGEALLRHNDVDDAVLKAYVIPAQININCNANDVSYLYVNYNAGNPVWQIGSSLSDLNGLTKVAGYVIGRNGTTLNIIDLRKSNVDFCRKYRSMAIESDGYTSNGFWRSVSARSVLASVGRNLTVSSGKYFFFNNPITHNAFDTSIAGTALANVFRNFYNRTGTWTQQADQKTVNNTQYDNAGVLTDLGNNKFRADYVYIAMDGASPYLFLVMGNAEYDSLLEAQGAPIPTLLPPQVDGISVLIGQVCVQKDAIVLTTRVAGASFSANAGGGGTGTSVHNDLSGIQGGTAAEYYHLTNTEYSNVQALPTTLAAKADLVGGKVPASQLPSFVDDVLEYADLASFPATGETGKIYIAISPNNKQYRWSGSAYVEIPTSPDNTDAVPEGSTNLYFTEPRVRSTLLTGLSLAVSTAIAATDSVLSAFGKLQAQITNLFSSKQDTLVSGTNIKTINGNSVLGAGDLSVGGSGGTALVAFSVANGGTPTLSGGSWQTIPLNSEVFDIGNSFNVGTYRFQPSVAGYYQFNATVYVETAVTQMVVGIWKNGGSSAITGDDIRSSVRAATASGMLYLNGTTDYVSLHVLLGSSVAITSGACMLSGVLIPGSATAPAGGDKQIQYNDGGALAGNANFTWDKTTNTLTIGGSAAKLKGDFSNGTQANRLLLQTSTTNGNTNVELIPDGTGTSSTILVNSSSDPANGIVGLVQATTTGVKIESSKRGSATYQPLLFFTNNTERARIDISGNLMVNTNTIGALNATGFTVETFSGGIYANFAHNGTTGGEGYAFFRLGGTILGSITQVSSTGVSYNTSSDYRLKEEPEVLTGSGEFIDALIPRSWIWKADGTRGVGFLAHEVQEISESSVTGEKDAVGIDGVPIYQSMSYSSPEIIANIVAELKALRIRVAELESITSS